MIKFYSVNRIGATARSVVVSVIAIMSVVSAAHAGGRERCSLTSMSTVDSPDGMWIARVYGKLCDLGIESSAAVMVDLVRAKLSERPVTVLSVDMPSNNYLWPKPKWISAKELLIQLPANANVALQIASVQGVNIRLKFCPSASANRKEWLSYQAAYHKWIEDTATWIRAEKQDPTKAGPEPTQPKPPGPVGNSCGP